MNNPEEKSLYELYIFFIEYPMEPGKRLKQTMQATYVWKSKVPGWSPVTCYVQR